MAVNFDKVEKVVQDLVEQQHFKGVNRFPRSFYTNLNDEEKAEAIRIYRKRYGLAQPHKPWNEEKGK